jgi:hypothetical protein
MRSRSHQANVESELVKSLNEQLQAHLICADLEKIMQRKFKEFEANFNIIQRPHCHW